MVTEWQTEKRRIRYTDQVNKDGHPYIGNPIRGTDRVATPLKKTVASLQDTMEDTGYTEDMKRTDGFDEQAIETLPLFTHKPQESYMEYVRRLAPNPVAWHVKLADNMNLDRLSVGVGIRGGASADAWVNA